MNVSRIFRSLAAAAGVLIASGAIAGGPTYNVALTTTGDCTTNGHAIVTVKLNVTGGASTVAGAQVFLDYSSFLSATNASVTAGPGLQGIVLTASDATHKAAIAVGVNGPTQTINNGDTIATIDFTYTGTTCATAGLATFDTAHNPPSTLTNNAAQAIPFTSSNLTAITLGDSTPPVFTYSPPNVLIECDVAPTLANTGGTATATDNCTTVTVTYTDSAPIAVSPGNLNGWSLFATQANTNTPGGDGTANFVVGPAVPPLGTGSAHLNTGTSGEQAAEMWNGSWDGTRIDAITRLGYSTYVTQWNGQQVPYLKFYVNYSGGSGVDDALYFEPDYSSSTAGNLNPFPFQGPPALNVWQTWDALHGMWWADDPSFAGSGGSNAKTLAAYLALHPNAKIVSGSGTLGGVRFASGFASPGDVFNAYVDNFQISTATSSAIYNFDPTAFPCTDNIITRTWKAVDHCNNSSTYVQAITQRDTIPPVITCPPDVTVNADAGGCTATFTYTNTFDAAPALSNAAGPGVFYVDRFPPAGFTSASFLGGNRLKHSISSADSISNRPIAYQSNFYNTQGRDFDVNIPVGGTIGIDLYIDPTWLTGALRRADLWAVGRDNTNTISDYAIIGFSSSNPAGDTVPPGSENPDPAQTGGVPRWRVYSDSNVGLWTTVGPAPTAGWHRLEITLAAATKTYKLDGVPVLTMTNYGSVRFSSALIQAYNFGTLTPPVAGSSYDVYWDNFLYGPQGPVATDNCSVSVSYSRPGGLTLFDPFPTGPTSITWTATDCAGHAVSCVQTVTVNPSNTLAVTVELAGTSSSPVNAPFTRCITFNLYTAGPCALATTVTKDITFTNGIASNAIGSATINVPCASGPYTGITATDTHHTLRRTGVLSVSAPNYASNFTSALALQGGNINNDPYIDILDFGGYIGQFGTSPGATTTCAPGLNADFSGNGSIGTEDFTFIQSGFLNFRDADPCGVPLTGEAPTTDISVADLVARGMRSYALADFNLDGRLNAADIAYVSQHGLPRCIADFNDDQATDVSDIFAFLNAWFADHPKADVNNNGRADVQDVFQFLDVWFQGC